MKLGRAPPRKLKGRGATDSAARAENHDSFENLGFCILTHHGR
jgi:hypothetical protein